MAAIVGNCEARWFVLYCPRTRAATDCIWKSRPQLFNSRVRHSGISLCASALMLRGSCAGTERPEASNRQCHDQPALHASKARCCRRRRRYWCRRCSSSPNQQASTKDGCWVQWNTTVVATVPLPEQENFCCGHSSLSLAAARKVSTVWASRVPHLLPPAQLFPRPLPLPPLHTSSSTLPPPTTKPSQNRNLLLCPTEEQGKYRLSFFTHKVFSPARPTTLSKVFACASVFLSFRRDGPLDGTEGSTKPYFFHFLHRRKVHTYISPNTTHTSSTRHRLAFIAY